MKTKGGYFVDTLEYEYQGAEKPREHYKMDDWVVDQDDQQNFYKGNQRSPFRPWKWLAAVMLAAVVLIVALTLFKKPTVTVALPEFVAVEVGKEVAFPYATLTDQVEAQNLAWAVEDGSLVTSSYTNQVEAKKLAWAVADESLLTVQDGVVTGLAVGETTLTAYSGENTAFSKVFVLGQSLKDACYPLTHEGQWYEAENGSKLFCVDGAYYWHEASLADNEILMSLLRQAAIQELGAVSTVEKENHLVCYGDEQHTDYDGSMFWAVDQDQANVAVVCDGTSVKVFKLDELQPPAAKVTGLTMEQTQLDLEVGAEKILTVYQVYDDGSVVLAQDLVWSCDNDQVVRVQNGTVKAMSAGSAVVTAVSGEFSCETRVNVADPEPEETEAPTEKVTQKPTVAPTEKPTQKPTVAPTEKPTQKPTVAPTEKPTQKPTEAPTEKPTQKPTEAPTEPATQPPTTPPTEEPAGRAPTGYSIRVNPTTVIVEQDFYVTVTPDVSDYTKIVVHAIDPRGGRWDQTISSGNSCALEIYDYSLTGTWTFYADVYNPYGVFQGAASGARAALTVYSIF